jgi:hypothetical protein
MSAKPTRFARRTGRTVTPRILNFVGQTFGPQFRETVLDRATLAIKISQNELTVCLAACIACARLAMNHDSERSCASRVEFELHLVRGFQYFPACSVCRRAKSKMMKRSGDWGRAVPHDFHVPQSALEVARSLIFFVGG